MGEHENTVSEDFLRESKRLFDAGVEAIDSATAARLRAARRSAASEIERPAWVVTPRVWLPAAAAAGLLALVILPGREPAEPAGGEGFEAVAASDLEILLGEEELEMLADFEFYEWLDMQELEGGNAEIEDGVG